MKLYYKILWLTIICIFFASNLPAFADLKKASVISPINAKSNAQVHNNLGTQYFNEKDYFAAIKEYRIAIGINTDSQTTATYFNNLGKVYLVLGEIQKRNNLPTNDGGDFSQMAQRAFEEAITLDCMKLEYYQNLISAYELVGVMENKKNFFMKNIDKNPFNVIPIALILTKQGQIGQANMMLDDFVTNNPDIIISNDLKKFIKANGEILPPPL